MPLGSENRRSGELWGRSWVTSGGSWGDSGGSERVTSGRQRPKKKNYFLKFQIMKLCENLNPTSPLGLGGLAWGIRVYLFYPSGERFTSPPTPSPWASAGGAAEGRRLLERLVGHLVAFLFSIIFSMPFLIDFWLVFHPNLAPKIDPNRSKSDAKMHSILDSIFSLIFGRFSVSTWTPLFEKNLIFLRKILFFENTPFGVNIDF